MKRKRPWPLGPRIRIEGDVGVVIGECAPSSLLIIVIVVVVDTTVGITYRSRRDFFLPIRVEDGCVGGYPVHARSGADWTGTPAVDERPPAPATT